MIRLEEGANFLAKAGLNMLAIFACRELPPTVTQIMAQSGVPLDAYRRLVLLGHGGRRLWEALSDEDLASADPVDDYSTHITRQFIDRYLGSPAILWLYPSAEYIIPLQRLGEIAGWSHPSPLGLGIHPQFGVWFAYRSAFLTTAELPVRQQQPGTSPCASCAGKPCMQTCPVGAVRPGNFDVDGCARYRIAGHSPCADRCRARMACPFFPEHRYTLAQIQYHYGRSLETLQAWYNSS